MILTSFAIFVEILYCFQKVRTLQNLSEKCTWFTLRFLLENKIRPGHHTKFVHCALKLRKWSQGKPKYLKFGIPMIWRESKNHLNDCKFTKLMSKGSTGKTNSISSILIWTQRCFQLHTGKRFKCLNLQGFLIFMTKFFLKFQQWMMKKVKTLIWNSIQKILFLES